MSRWFDTRSRAERTRHAKNTCLPAAEYNIREEELKLAGGQESQASSQPTRWTWPRRKKLKDNPDAARMTVITPFSRGTTFTE